MWGGFGEAPKFPTPHHLLFLLWYAQAEDAPEALVMVEHTLDAMAQGRDSGPDCRRLFQVLHRPEMVDSPL